VAGDRVRVLIVGAGEASEKLLRDIQHNPALGLRPVALVDDDPRKLGLSLHGVSVVANRTAIPSLVRRLDVAKVLMAIPTATGDVIRDVASLCEESGVALGVLPSVREIVDGRVTARDIRDLRIEDLLGRQQVQTDLEAVRAILAGRRVMVTGAGGSIGSEIVRQVASFAPSSLILLDHDETHLHDLLTEVEEAGRTAVVLADIRDRDRTLAAFMEHRPEIVFHAAAHKHVHLMEAHPQEALATNILGTANVAEAASIWGTERFVLISTDKAVKPESVMGASKWFAERIVRTLHGNGCAFCVVRFGNVLGSRGSVIPTFFRQIARGGPVTVTDPSMARYFMSVGEAVQLVLQAASLAEGGEVFTLDMGNPVNILDLAHKVISLSGRVRDIEVEIIGPRVGEKLVEDLMDPEEHPEPTSHPKIVVSRPALPPPASVRSGIRELQALAGVGMREELAVRMKQLTRVARESVPVGMGG
jgi:FlaA1/EpsC-like NDP-sugar epimerase